MEILLKEFEVVLDHLLVLQSDVRERSVDVQPVVVHLVEMEDVEQLVTEVLYDFFLQHLDCLNNSNLN